MCVLVFPLMCVFIGTVCVCVFPLMCVFIGTVSVCLCFSSHVCVYRYC